MLTFSYPNLDLPRGDGPGRAVNSPTLRGTAGPSAGVGCPATTLHFRKTSTHMSLETTLGITADGIVPPGRAEQARALIRSGRDGGAERKCPADPRIEAFLAEHFADLGLPAPLRLPDETLVLPRHGIARELSLPEGSDSYQQRLPELLPRPQRRAAQPAERPPHHRRARSTSPRAACRSPATRRPCPRRVFARPLPPRRERRRRSCSSLPFTAQPAGARRAFVSLLLRPLVCPEVPGVVRREDDGGPLLRAGRPGQQPRLRRVHLRQRRRPVPARERRGPRCRALDRPHRLRHPRPAPDRAHQEGARPAALGRRHRAAAARRHVLEGPGRDVQRRRGVQAHLPHRRRRDRHADRRQLLRLLQEGSEDADQLRRQPLRQRRGGTRRRRARLRQLQPRRRVPRRQPHGERPHVRRRRPRLRRRRSTSSPKGTASTRSSRT